LHNNPFKVSSGL